MNVRGTAYRMYQDNVLGADCDKFRWPLPNVWLGVSVEDQKRADERIPLLLQTPAAVRFLSCEPLLEAVDLTRLYGHVQIGESVDLCVDALRGLYTAAWSGRSSKPETPLSTAKSGAGQIDWVIVGGESGHGARDMRLDWAQRIVNDCRDAGVPVFVKQLGARPVEFLSPLPMVHKKGGDPSEWPKDLRVREYPR
jgi:protein gp37